MSKNNLKYRVHNVTGCKCRRLRRGESSKTVDSSRYVIEVTDSIDHYRNHFITGETADEDLKLYFSKFNTKKKLLYEYFNQYEWRPDLCELVRKCIYSIPPVSLCFTDTLTSQSRSNGGIVLMSSMRITKMLSHAYNKYVTKTEFNQMFYCPMTKLSTIPEEKRGGMMNMFMKSNAWNQSMNRSSTHTIIGLSNPKRGDTISKYDISFGKREWYADSVETNFQCALREFFEEFNIQLSKDIIEDNNYVEYKIGQGASIFLFDLGDDVDVHYHQKSDTIYVS